MTLLQVAVRSEFNKYEPNRLNYFTNSCRHTVQKKEILRINKAHNVPRESATWLLNKVWLDSTWPGRAIVKTILEEDNSVRKKKCLMKVYLKLLTQRQLHWFSHEQRHFNSTLNLANPTINQVNLTKKQTKINIDH